MLPRKAIEICENGNIKIPEKNIFFPKFGIFLDVACGGFTFKGAFSVVYQPVEVYFFHYVEDPIHEENYFHWSTYRVRRRNYVIIDGASMESSQNDFKDTCQEK